MKIGSCMIGGVLFGWVCSFLIPISSFLLFTCFVVFVDFITGWMASGKPIHSRGIRKTFEKLTFYMLGTLAAHGFDVTYLNNSMSITYAISGMIALTELLSVYENIDKGTGTGLLHVVKKLLTPHDSPRK
jgi:hypothetical protein